MSQQNSAFSLVEILISLAILGIIASITIPIILENMYKEAWVSQLKKTYVTLENARRLTALDYGGDISELYAPDATFGNVAYKAFAPHLNISKNCGTAKGCWSENVKYLDNTLYSSDGKWDTHSNGYNGKAILTDGTLIDIEGFGSSCKTDNSTAYSPSTFRNYCGNIYVDVNGKKSPNTVGKDIFEFEVTKDGIYPGWTEDSPSQLDANCTNGQGWACAAKVLKENAMNY